MSVSEMLEEYEYGSDENDPEFGGLFGNIGNFVSNAAKVAGKEIGRVGNTIQSAGGTVTKAIGKVPVVGAPLNTVLGATYRTMTAPADIVYQSAIKGKRLDKAVVGNLKQQVKDAKDLAPYAKTVVSMVPGVGSGAAAAIGAGLALAEGQPIDKALLTAVTSAVPGGPLAQAMASVAAKGISAAAHGEKFDVAAATSAITSGLPIPKEAKDALATGIRLTGDIAAGRPVNKALAESALKLGSQYLPADAKKALQTGLGVGVAHVMQTAKIKALPSVTGKLLESGVQLSKTMPVVAEARKLAGKGTKGFDLGHGLLGQRSSLFDVMHVRAGLKPDDKKGFDMALANRIGLVTHPPTKGISPAAHAGKTIVDGMQEMKSPRNKMAIMKTLTASPSAEVGAKVAMNQIAARRKSWPVRVVDWVRTQFGHKPEARPLVTGPDAKRTLVSTAARRSPVLSRPKVGAPVRSRIQVKR